MANDILIILGSESDRELFDDTAKYAGFFGLTFELAILSAHRNPEQLHARLRVAENDGTSVVVACAGMAAHLAGACAAQTTLPVIGVPASGSTLGGLDALLSTVQMPAGVPVATVAIGKAGARNAIILAAQIIALKRPELKMKLRDFKEAGCRL
ncbi:5-(carboxyamino)imidazole ribonucleotide mutase [bacterium]|nr:5-(carboxyamino)imidazole ribonucleotide mutase [bacterium]